MLLLLAACIYRRPISFRQEMAVQDTVFFSQITTIAKEKKLLAGNARISGETKFYRIVFHERQVESGNVVDYSNVPVDTLAVSYSPLLGGTYQELYLAHIPTTDATHQVYVYYSLNYNADMQVVGFGPSYIGQLVKCPNDTARWQIEFYASLKTKRKSPYVLKKASDTTDVKFVLSKYAADSCIIVSKVIESNPNKIGGSRPLVFNVDSILGQSRLNFKYIKK